jgi:hypothetical protein
MCSERSTCALEQFQGHRFYLLWSMPTKTKTVSNKTDTSQLHSCQACRRRPALFTAYSTMVALRLRCDEEDDDWWAVKCKHVQSNGRSLIWKGICFKTLKKTAKNLSQDNWYSCRDLTHGIATPSRPRSPVCILRVHPLTTSITFQARWMNVESKMLGKGCPISKYYNSRYWAVAPQISMFLR